ncbi:MAG: HAD family hydrolase [Hyphomicrobiales bacterium]
MKTRYKQMKPDNTKLIIFDCDGVLIDSEIISATTLIGLLKDLNVHIDFPYVQKNFIGRSFQKVAAEISQSFGITLPADFEATYRAELLQAFVTELKPTDGILAMLSRMQIPICIATSSSPERAGRSLQITKLAPFFEGNIFTASLVKNGKPAPDLFLLAAKTMNVEPKNCLVIEDSLPGIEAALNANMPVWHYKGGSHLQGISLAHQKHSQPHQSFSTWCEFEHLQPQFFKK